MSLNGTKDNVCFEWKADIAFSICIGSAIVILA